MSTQDNGNAPMLTQDLAALRSGVEALIFDLRNPNPRTTLTAVGEAYASVADRLAGILSTAAGHSSAADAADLVARYWKARAAWQQVDDDTTPKADADPINDAYGQAVASLMQAPVLSRDIAQIIAQEIGMIEDLGAGENRAGFAKLVRYVLDTIGGSAVLVAVTGNEGADVWQANPETGPELVREYVDAMRSHERLQAEQGEADETQAARSRRSAAAAALLAYRGDHPEALRIAADLVLVGFEGEGLTDSRLHAGAWALQRLALKGGVL